MDILVAGFVIGLIASPIVLIWLWVRMVRRDRARAQRVEQGEAAAAVPQGFIERRMHDLS